MTITPHLVLLVISLIIFIVDAVWVPSPNLRIRLTPAGLIFLVLAFIFP